MSTPLENRPWWNDVVAKLKSRKLRDLAREHKVSVAELQNALERTGHLPKPTAEASATSSNAPAPEKAPTAAPAKGRGGRKPAAAKTAPEAKPAAKAPKAAKSPKAAAAPEAAADKSEGGRANDRLEQIRDLLGKIPDGEAADKAGVARKTVVEFRKRHGITRYRGEGAGEAPKAPKKAEAKAAPAAAPEAKVTEVPVKRKPGRPRKTEQVAKVEKPAKAPKAGKPAPVSAKAPVAAKEEAPSAADEGAESDASKATGRASKLDAFLHIVGKRPDREVAEESGMTTENVRMYRLRRGIAAEWRGEGGSTRGAAKAARGAKAAAPAAEVAVTPAASVATAPAAPAEKAAPAAAAAESAEGNTKVDRAIARYISEIGKVPDAEIAEKAGISRSAVSAYRQRHGIKASGRGGRPPGSGRAAAAPAAAPAPKAAAAKAPEAKAPEAKAPVAKAPEAKAPEAKAPEAKAPEAKAPAAAPKAAAAATGGFVYRVAATRGGEEKVFGVAAGNVVEAAQLAYERLTARDDRWVIEKIRLLGSALP